MKLNLVPLVSNSRCTISLLDVPGCGSLYTIERPWVPDSTEIYGKPGVSCLPAGDYALEKLHSPTFSPRYGRDCYYITSGDDIPARKTDDCARWGTLFHGGNRASDLRGCVAPAMSRAARGNYVNQSRVALDKLHEWLDANPGPHTLNIERLAA